MGNFEWWLKNPGPGTFFLNHIILAERLRKLLPWKLPELVYEGSDYDEHATEPDITEASIFGTKCELLYKDIVFTKITFMCFEDSKMIRMELESPDQSDFFPYQDFTFDIIEKSWEQGILIQVIKDFNK